MENLIKLLEKYSKYEILNNLIPGFALCYILSSIGYHVWDEDWVINITLPLYTISSLFFYTFRLPAINIELSFILIFLSGRIRLFSHRLISLTIVFVFITCMSGLIILIAEKFRWGKLLIIGK